MMRTRRAAEDAHLIFDLHGWEYFDGAPDVDRLEGTIRSLLRSEGDRSETGRLLVIRDEEGFRKVCLILTDDAH